MHVCLQINLSVAVPKVDPEDPTLPFEEARWIRRDRNGPQQASHLDQDPSSSNVNVCLTLHALIRKCVRA